MHLFLCYDIDSIPLDQALALVSPQRREQVLAFRPEASRKRCAGAYLLLRLALHRVFGIDEPPLLGYATGGKPFLQQYPHIHFNLSHCREAVACAVDTHPVGVDVEGLTHYSPSVAEYVCNGVELQSVLHAPDPAVAFIRLWTRKEATVKLSGKGIDNDIKTAISDQVSYLTTEVPSHHCVYTVASYSPIPPLQPVTVSFLDLLHQNLPGER